MKTLLTLALVVSGASFAFSQGSVNFANTPANFTTTATVAANGHQDRLVYGTDNVTKLSGTNWIAQLYYSAGASQAESSLHTVAGDTGVTFRAPTPASGNGFWTAGSQPVLNDVTPGGTATLQVRVWDGSLFSSYTAAVTGGGITGKSATFNYTTGGGGSPPATPGGMEGLQSFTLQTPEPSTIALGLLGAASLFVVRRRK